MTNPRRVGVSDDTAPLALPPACRASNFSFYLSSLSTVRVVTFLPTRGKNVTILSVGERAVLSDTEKSVNTVLCRVTGGTLQGYPADDELPPPHRAAIGA